MRWGILNCSGDYLVVVVVELVGVVVEVLDVPWTLVPVLVVVLLHVSFGFEAW
jgi:hypothetical protein